MVEAFVVNVTASFFFLKHFSLCCKRADIPANSPGFSNNTIFESLFAPFSSQVQQYHHITPQCAVRKHTHTSTISSIIQITHTHTHIHLKCRQHYGKCGGIVGKKNIFIGNMEVTNITMIIMKTCLFWASLSTRKNKTGAWTDRFVSVRMSSVASQQQNQKNWAVPSSTSLKPSQNALVTPWLATKGQSKAAAAH